MILEQTYIFIRQLLISYHQSISVIRIVSTICITCTRQDTCFCKLLTRLSLNKCLKGLEAAFASINQGVCSILGISQEAQTEADIALLSGEGKGVLFVEDVFLQTALSL